LYVKRVTRYGYPGAIAACGLSRRPAGKGERHRRALGLQTAQGISLTEAWYWDLNDDSRAWTKRWQAERPGKIPTSDQAGVYSAVLHHLKTVEALKSDADGRAVAAKNCRRKTGCSARGRCASTGARCIRCICSR
jgi:hypothetical protein